ncbi:hypothetical protein [Cellulomonas dongxiuzhuiae]|uniref:YrdC-like domain-containing protein n=1 Tax=Cellulomonas dongxiuzhuiae TaxID=2819979 RepID=A0ABX8GLN0_9CELL|nr:hypothetical protein [Cellulomonas dongxiuzhuiae]MBO3095449.1 hypothetical protein [Cellulomonas dongxiuzhuiae]QWC16431.1 hypothetical protein KKR89_01775 [Cellulomonas dongxiuzhuiae]
MPADDRLVLDRPDDVAHAVRSLADGVPVAHGFGNIYALTGRADAVVRINALKGRPHDQTGSLTAPAGRVLSALDLSALPACVSPGLLADVVDAFRALGPFGFRGPAAAHVPPGLTALDGSVTTAQVIVPGDACPSQRFLAASSDAVGLLAISSANRSRHVTGQVDAPVHWRADALRAELAGGDLVLLEHGDEAAARARFPRHTTVSTTILAFHRAERVRGRVHLTLERHGSLAAQEVAQVLAALGLGVTAGPRAAVRLAPRSYDDGPGPTADRRASPGQAGSGPLVGHRGSHEVVDARRGCVQPPAPT